MQKVEMEHSYFLPDLYREANQIEDGRMEPTFLLRCARIKCNSAPHALAIGIW